MGSAKLMPILLEQRRFFRVYQCRQHEELQRPPAGLQPEEPFLRQNPQAACSSCRVRLALLVRMIPSDPVFRP